MVITCWQVFNAKGAGDGWNKADRHILQPIEAHQNALDNPSANNRFYAVLKAKPYNSILIVDAHIKIPETNRIKMTATKVKQLLVI